MSAAWKAVRDLAARIGSGRLWDLLVPGGHAPYLARHRAEAIVTRIRLVALGFSGLTLLWIGLDALTLDTRQWLILAAFRLAAVAAFAGLALIPTADKGLRSGLAMLAAALAIPMILFAVAQILLGGGQPTGLAAVNAALYEALPYIVLAGLSIFPLVAVEGMLFALPILGVVAAVQVGVDGFDPVRQVSTLWVLGLALGVYMLASAIQLHYMMALLRRASHDPLTGALTRRSGVEVMDLQFQLSLEQDKPFAVAFFDVDNFKGVNDTHGHEAGDQALRDAVDALNTLLRQTDTVIRWGGEEFVVILAGTGADGIRTVIGRILRDWLGKRPDGLPLTASIGVAERLADHADDWSRLVALADERMYKAKTSGKARCVVSDTVTLTP